MDIPAALPIPQPVQVPELVLRPPVEPVVHHLPCDLPLPAQAMMPPRGGLRLGGKESRGCSAGGPGNSGLHGACSGWPDRLSRCASGEPAASRDGRDGERRSAHCDDDASDGESERGRTVQRSRANQGELSVGHVNRVLTYHPFMTRPFGFGWRLQIPPPRPGMRRAGGVAGSRRHLGYIE